MARDNSRRLRCKVCDRPRAEGELFSTRGKCQACAEAAMIDNAMQLAAHSGPAFDRWRESMARSVGAPPPGG